MFGALSPQQMASLQQAMQMAQAMGALQGGQARGMPMMAGMPGMAAAPGGGGPAHAAAGMASLAGLMGAAQGAGAGLGRPGIGAMGGMGQAMAGLQALQMMGGGGAFRQRAASVSPQPLQEHNHNMGWIEKQGGIVKSWKKRYFVLSDNMLRYFASPEERSPKGTILLANIQSTSEVSNAQAKIGLVLQTPNRAYLLRFDAEEARTQWRTAIQAQLNRMRGIASPPSAALPSRVASAPTASGVGMPSAPNPAETIARVGAPTLASATTTSTPASPGAPPQQPAGPSDNKSLPPVSDYTFPNSRRLNSCYNRLVQHAQGEQNGGVLLLTGETGSGVSAMIAEFVETLSKRTSKELEKDPFYDVCHGWHEIAAQVCACGFTRLSSPNSKAPYTVREDAGSTAAVEGGLERIRTGDACPTCHAATTVQWMVVSQEEVQQAVGMFNAKRVPLDVILLRCRNCNAVAFPMAEDTLCVAQEGQIMTVSGKVMPRGDQPQWRSLFAHVCRSCSLQQLPLEHLPLRLNVADMDALGARVEALPPHRARAEVPTLVALATRGSVLTNSVTLRGMLAGLNLSLQQLPLDGQNSLPVAMDGLMTQLANGLQQATTLSHRSAALIIVDLDDHTDCDFGWIPVPLPPSVRIIIASPPSARHEQALEALSQQVGFAYHKVVAPALSVEDSIGILSNMWCPITGMPFPEGDRVRTLINANHTGSALYLRLLCGFARHHKIPFDELSARVPPSLDALISAVLSSLQSPLDKAVAAIAALSRHFLAPDYIISAARHMVPTASEADVKRVLEGTLSIFLTPITDRYLQTTLLHCSLATAIIKQLLPGAELDRAHAQLAAHAASKLDADFTSVPLAEDLTYHLMRSEQADKAREALLKPAMAEARIKGGRGQVLLVDLETAISRLPGSKTELEAHLDFVCKNFTRLYHGATFADVSRTNNTAISTPLLHGLVGDDDHLHSRIVRIFTSSTFDDLKVERDALMREAYPRLRQWCESRRLEFQVVDMRWGIRDESTNDHQTTAICMQEIAECQRVSIGPNFVTFLSQRYGYRPFPDKIVDSDFQALLAHVDDAAHTALLNKWFLLDTNMQPPMRVLQPVSTFLPDFLNEAAPDQRAKARSEWWSSFEAMCTALRKAAQVVFRNNRDKLLPYIFSVTDNEIRTGLLALSPQVAAEQCLWFKRNIRDLDKYIESGDKRVGAFTDLVWGTNTVEPDAKLLLGDLRGKELPAALPAANVHEYDVDFKAGVGIDAADPVHAKYLATLVEDFQSSLTASITASLARLPSHGLAQEEILQHLIYARDEHKRFGGRKAMLDVVRTYLRSPDLCSPLVISGESGCGKSALMAAIAHVAREEIAARRIAGRMGGPSGAVVVRFVGLTADSSEITSLLRTLLLQLTQLLSIDMPTCNSAEELQKAFMTVLCKFGSDSPLVLLLDGLDQIAETNFGRELNRWLPPNFPCGLKIVLSMLTGKKARVFPVIRRHLYGQPGFEGLFHTLGRLDHTEAVEIIHMWLASDRRQLTPAQHQELADAFRECSSPLYIRLAYNEARRWTSYTPDTSIKLPRTIRGAITALFARLVRVHGRKLVENASMYLALARDGLSFTELEHLLSLDEDVLNDVFQYWEPPQRRLPPLLWVRLRRDLGEFLFESHNGAQIVYRWAHAQFRQAVEEEFLKLPAETIIQEYEPTVTAMKTDEAVRLAALLLESPVDPTYTPAPSAVAREMHKRAAEFWQGKWHGQAKPYTTAKGVSGTADRCVPRNPALLDAFISNEHYLHPNTRRCRELPRHLALAGMADELAAELTDPAVIDFYVAPGRENAGEMRALFGVLGGMNGAAKIYLDSLTASAKTLASADSMARAAALIRADGVTLLFGLLEHRTGPHMTEVYDAVLAVRGGVLGPDHSSSAAILMQKAYQMIGTGNMQEAIALANRVLEIRFKANGEISEPYALALINSAEILKKCRQFNPAAEYLQKAIVILRRLNTSSVQDTIGASLNNLGHLMLEIGQGPQSIFILQEAVQVLERVLGSDHQDLANALNNLSSALQIRQQPGDIQHAMQMMARVIQIRQFRLGSRHPLVAQAMNNMATLYFGTGHVDEALPLLQRAVEIARLMDNSIERDDDLGTYINNLASAYQMKGRLPEAMPLYDEALGLLRKCPTTNPRNLAQAIQNLAGVLLDMRHLDRAEALFRESLPLFERHYGPMDAKTGLTVEGIACCLQLKGRSQEALPWIQRTHQIQAASGQR